LQVFDDDVDPDVSVSDKTVTVSVADGECILVPEFFLFLLIK
jgi:hypothetical protein